MDSPVLPRTSQPPAAGNLFDESVESGFGDLSVDDDSFALPATRPAAVLPRPAASKPRFSLFAPPRPVQPPVADPPSAFSGSRGTSSSNSATARTFAPSPPPQPTRDASTYSPSPSATASPAHASASSSSGSSLSSSRPLTVSQLGYARSSGLDAAGIAAEGDETISGEPAGETEEGEEDGEAQLRRTLHELQGLNALFDKLLLAREGVNAVHQRALAQTTTTNALLDNYIATLRDEERTLALVRNPGWTGAHDDAIHMQAVMAAVAREQEELRAAAQRLEEEAAARARAEAERARAEAEEAARRRELAASGAGGRGGTRGGRVLRGSVGAGRGIPRGSVRGVRGRPAGGLS